MTQRCSTPIGDIVVSDGVIVIESIQVLRASDGAVYFLLDSQQKRPCLMGSGGTNESVMVYVGADEQTLKVVDPNAPMTEIRFTPNEPGDWHMFADTGRYKIEVCAVRVDAADSESKPVADCPHHGHFTGEHTPCCLHEFARSEVDREK